MIKTLQKKFIITAMAAITVLILVLLGTINGINIWRVHNESDNTMNMLLDTESKNAPSPMDNAEAPENPADMQPPEDMGTPEDIGNPYDEPYKKPGMNDIFNPAISEDMVMAARYFSARVDSDGDIVYVDVSHISSVDEAEAMEYVQQVIGGSSKEGSFDNLHYQIRESADGQGSVIVFLNVSNIRRTILSVLIISIIIGLVGWILMLLLVIGLSKHAIRPIAANIERQKQFVTDAGHEIKTPLAIILANTDAMELHNGESKWSKNIRSQAERLSGLMKNLLSLSKMDEGNLNTVMEDVDISRLSKDIVEAFLESAELKNIDLGVDINDNIKVHANKEHMTQLINILMDNAIKYTPEDGHIRFTLHEGHHNCIIKCQNSCETLPDVPAGRLFDRFYRGDSARTQKNGGYGIGLSVAKAIAEMYKGKISAEYVGDREIIFKVVI